MTVIHRGYWKLKWKMHGTAGIEMLMRGMHLHRVNC
jgi:hypothetical protein